MDRQLSDEEICSERLLCGASESFLKAIFPRTPSRYCSGSTRRFKSYLVKVNAVRSRAWTQIEHHTTQTTQRNLITASSAAASQFQKARLRPQLKHSVTALVPALESKPENRISCSPGREVPCLPRPIPKHNPSCNRSRRSSASRAHPGLRSTVL